VDFLDFLNIAARKIFFDSYNSVILKFPKLYGALYKASDNSLTLKTVGTLSEIAKNFGSKKFEKYIKNFNPDYVLFTHFSPADLFSRLKINIPCGVVVTDYLPHWLWSANKNATYFVANESAKKHFEKYNIKRDKIFITGIPVEPEFYERENADGLKNKYDIQNTLPTIVVFPPGKGKVNIVELIKNILQKENKNLFILTGKNKKLKNELDKIQSPNNKKFEVIGWTNKAVDYMRLADLIITKPGGLTVTECVTLGKPMILLNPIPGQEEHNINFVEKNKYGIGMKSARDFESAMKNITSLKKTTEKTFQDYYPAKKIIRLIGGCI
jgi:processive 1,2-diacylglycerol beta-glucosyltransferase